MMKKIIFLFLLTNFTTASFGQFPAPVDSIYTFIKSNSAYRNTVDWTPIDIAFRKNLMDAKSLKDTMNCFVFVLDKLNDVHTQIFLNNQYYGNYPQFDDTILTWLKPLNDKAVSVTNKIHTQLLTNKIGYVRVPSIQAYNKKQINNYAQSLYDSINKFALKKLKGFIIDLRLNGGGNIYPMLSGLSSFLGDGVIGYETDINDSIIRKWEIKEGNFVIGGYQTTELAVNLKSTYRKMPVVILISPVTKSSGSMTAIAFKKRPKTFFIGEPTADGYTTSNNYFQFAPNLMLNFATNFVADRAMTIYKTTVNPDINIHPGDNFENLMDDKKIKLAIQWLNKNISRSRTP
jgi:carboxyl-terminal processing protease